MPKKSPLPQAYAVAPDGTVLRGERRPVTHCVAMKRKPDDERFPNHWVAQRWCKNLTLAEMAAAEFLNASWVIKYFSDVVILEAQYLKTPIIRVEDQPTVSPDKLLASMK